MMQHNFCFASSRNPYVHLNDDHKKYHTCFSICLVGYKDNRAVRMESLYPSKDWIITPPPAETPQNCGPRAKNFLPHRLGLKRPRIHLQFSTFPTSIGTEEWPGCQRRDESKSERD